MLRPQIYPNSYPNNGVPVRPAQSQQVPGGRPDDLLDQDRAGLTGTEWDPEGFHRFRSTF